MTAVVSGTPPITGHTPTRPKSRGAGPWIEFAIKRTLGLIATVIALVIVTFLIIPLIPGDPAVQAAGSDASPARIEAVRVELGLDLPLAERFANYVGSLLDGTMGHSFTLNGTVAEIVFARLPFTAGLAVAAIVVVLLISVPLGMSVGILTRGGRRRALDQSFSVATGFVASVPGYVMATFLVLIFAVGLGLLPPAYARTSPAASFVLPVLALAIGPICTISRVVRRETAIVLEQDYMRTAAGWRLAAVRRYTVYALPNLLTSTLTLSGLVLTSMLGGAIIVETVFAWPGLGLGIVQAITNKDYPVIQGIILVLGVLAALLTLIVDILLGIVDPRTLGGRHDG